MNGIVFFGHHRCPFCRRVLDKLNQKKVNFEFNEVPIDRSVRGDAVYDGERVEFKGKKFHEIFDGNISIPKMILSDGRKLLESQDMINYFD